MHIQRQQISRALVQVKKILDQTRNAREASDVPHAYKDKYLLAESITGSTCASLLNNFQVLGVTPENKRKAVEWASERAVSIAFDSTETCVFDKKTTRKEESPTKHVTEASGILGKLKVTDKVVTTITEYHWNYSVSYEIYIYPGNAKEEKITLFSREGKTKLLTLSDGQPYPKKSIKPTLECQITWLLQRVAESNAVSFEINRSDEQCHTPSRNPDIEKAIYETEQLQDFMTALSQYFSNHIFSVPKKDGLDLTAINASNIFIPILPLLEEKNIDDTPGEILDTPQPTSDNAVIVKPGSGYLETRQTTTLLSPQDIGAFLGEEQRSVSEKLDDIKKILTSKNEVITADEGRIVVIAKHIGNICSSLHDCIDYIEGMLREQLIRAIGKEISAPDFCEYMRFHYRKVFKPEYQPKGLCYAVRRPEHDPEGIVSVEEKLETSTTPQPALTFTRCIPLSESFNFPLNAATSVSFTGNAFLHSYLGHRFSSESLPTLTLEARARQFSGYVMLLGTIGGKDLFIPKHAMIVRDKDDFRIPLILEEIPSVKEFKEAISSLSPEQQRFAEAYRSMQLEATLFGICIVQIKPQLEKVLNLPYDSLTKEIKLTQDLLNLFITYQIPSDLLSYQNNDATILVDATGEEGETDSISIKEKINQVRSNVDAMLQMIETSKNEELDQKKKEALFEFRDRDRARKRILTSPSKKDFNNNLEPKKKSMFMYILI